MNFLLFGIGSAIAVDYAETCRRLGHRITAGIANRGQATDLGETPVLAPIDLTAELRELPCLTPLFTPANRFVAVTEARALGLHFPVPLIDPTATIAQDFRAGGGSFVNAGVVIGAYTSIGEHVVINRAATVGHHGRIEDYASLGPGAILAGEIFVGRGAMIGTGAIVLPGRRIGEHAIVGAGAVVTADVEPYTKVRGSAASVVPGRSPGFPERS